jgi:hypothetical protein
MITVINLSLSFDAITSHAVSLSFRTRTEYSVYIIKRSTRYKI